MSLYSLVFPVLLTLLLHLARSENVFCTYYRETNEITCGTVTCETHVPLGGDLEEEGLDGKLPRGWYRIGALQIRHDSSWFNLYRRRATGSGYWDFYTNIPERNCAGGFGVHAGENIAGSVTVKDKRCFDRLVLQIERKSTSEKFDVIQCRKCLFNSCWLGRRSSMRTHGPVHPTSHRNAPKEESPSKRATTRAKKRSPATEVPAEIRSPGGSKRNRRAPSTRAGSSGLSSPLNSPDATVVDEGGPAKRTRLSERTASESGTGPATIPSEVSRLRRSPRIQENQEPVEVWRSPRRRASGFVSPLNIKQEPVEVVEEVAGKRNEELRNEESRVGCGLTEQEKMDTGLTSQAGMRQSPVRMEPMTILGESEDMHRREGSTETMAMCEESSDRSLLDGESEGTEGMIETTPVAPAQPSTSRMVKIAVSSKSRNVPLEPAQSSEAKRADKWKGKSDEVGLSPTKESVSPRKKKRAVNKNLLAEACSILRNESPRAVWAKKKGIRRGVARTRDAAIESIPPWIASTSEQRTEVVAPDEEPTEISPQMLINFAQSMKVPISRESFVDDGWIEPLRGGLQMALREVVDGSKMFADQARRERLTTGDVNAFMKHAHHPPLYGFMEEESWQRVGDVFVPNQKRVQLNSLAGSVKVETERMIDFKCTMVYANR